MNQARGRNAVLLRGRASAHPSTSGGVFERHEVCRFDERTLLCCEPYRVQRDMPVRVVVRPRNFARVYDSTQEKVTHTPAANLNNAA
jgi:hypothetical protein